MKRLLLFLLPLLAFSGCEEEITYVSPYGSIYGIVTEEGSSQPMEGLAVELYKDEALLLKTVTAADGSYEFSDVTAGKYTLIAKGLSYESAQFIVVVEGGRQARADMQLKKLYTYMDVTTKPVSDISGNSVTFNGTIDSQKNTEVKEWGFVYSTSSNLSNGKKVTATKSEANSYDFSITTTVSQLSSETTYYVAAFGTNEYGTTYGNTVAFRISGLPLVTALPATNITASAAVLNGRIDYAGDPAFTERGFVYSTTFQNPTIDDDSKSTIQKMVYGSSLDFSTNISGLDKSSTYYVRAYAINKVGIAYSEVITFAYSGELPTVKFYEVSDITETSVTFSGYITSNGFPTYTERGFVYSTTHTPTIENNKIISLTEKYDKIFKAQVTDLIAGTTYYIRAYAINNVGVAYSEEITFDYPGELPAVTVSQVSDETETSVTFNGSITDKGFPSYTERGFVYSTSRMPTVNDKKVISYTDKSSAKFEAQVTDFTVGTHYIRAYAINQMGIAYSNSEVSFVYSGQLPTVETLAPTDIKEMSVTLHGNITSVGKPAYTERGFVYSTTFQEPTINDEKRAVSGTGTGEFSLNLSGLAKETTYYVRAYATNSEGTIYGESIPFMTHHPDYIKFSDYGIMVQTKDLSSSADWETANTLCEDSRVGGFNDWRLPTLDELSFIYNLYLEGKIPNITKGDYWSSEYEYIEILNQTDCYTINFYTGSILSWSYYYGHRVRAVRTIK